jgi:hypothetical protein
LSAQAKGTLTSPTRQIEPRLLGAFDRDLVARVGVAHDAGGRVVP